jgi:hypothetical protein
LIVALLATGIATHSVRAEVRVQGSIENIRLEARDATITEILNALREHFSLRYRGAPASGAVTASYAGPLRAVLARVLEGYDYVIEPHGSVVEVIVLGGGAPRQAIVPPIVRRRSD